MFAIYHENTYKSMFQKVKKPYCNDKELISLLYFLQTIVIFPYYTFKYILMREKYYIFMRVLHCTI